MKAQMKSLEDVVNTIKGNEKFVLIGMLDLISQLEEEVGRLRSEVESIKGNLENLVKGKPVQGGPSGSSGGLSIG